MANNKLVVTLEGKDGLSGVIDKSKKSVKDFKNEVDKCAKSASGLEDYEKKFKQITSSMSPVETKMKQLQRLASDMQFKGLSGTSLFTQIAQEAGAAKDAIADTRDAISRFSDDNLKLNASIQGFSTLAAAGTTLAGVMGLIGVKSDEVTQAILKVQSALAVLNGIQQIANNLNKDSSLMQRIRQIQLEDAAAQKAKESIGNLASERLRDANALKGIAGARAADASTTAANTTAQAGNTETIIANTSENAVNTEKTAENTVAVDKNTQSRKANTLMTSEQKAAQLMAIAVMNHDTAAMMENIKMQAAVNAAERSGIITREESSAIDRTWTEQLAMGNASLESRIAVLNKYGFTLEADGRSIRKLSAAELENIKVESMTVEQEAALSKMRTALAMAVEKNTISLEKYLVVMKAYDAEVRKGNVDEATRIALLKTEGLMFDTASGRITKMPGLFARMTTRANEFTRAVVGMKLSTTLWVGAAVAAIYALYKISTAEDEYVKELNEEAKKLQESIDKQKNLTAEQAKAKAQVEALKKVQEDLNRVRDREKNYITTMGSTFSNLMQEYRNLAFQYNNLKSEHEKVQWIKNSQNAFQNLGIEINNTADAERIFNGNTDNIIEGFKLRAKAAAQAALAVESYKRAIELEQESTGTGMRGAIVSKSTAEKLPEKLRNQLQKNTHQESNTGPLSATELYQAQYTGQRSTHTVIDSYRVPFDASDELLKELAKHGFVAKGAAAEAKKEYDKANKLIDQSFETTKQAAKKLGGRVVPKPKNGKTTPTNTTTKTDDTVLGRMEKELKALTDQRRDIDLNTDGAEDKIKNLDKLIKAQEKKIKDYKIKVGIDTEPVKDSLEWINKQITDLETALKSNKLPVGVSVEEAKKKIEQFKRDKEQEEIRIGLKVVPQMGSVGELQQKIEAINKRLQDEDVSMPVRISLVAQQQDLQNQINEKVHGKLTIPAKIEPQMTRVKGDLFDLRQSRANAQATINQIVDDFENGIIKSKKEALDAIKEINDKLAELGIKPIEIEIETKGVSKTIQGIEAVAGAAADAFTAIGEASEAPELNIAGILAGGVASIIQGYGQATSQAASMGPWAWIAFGLAATAQLVSMMSAVTQVRDQAGFANGGIVGGNSPVGDKLGIRVNSGEMVMNKNQQAKLWNTINNGGRVNSGSYFDKPRIVGKIQGRDMILVMQNENKIRQKAGIGLGIG